MSISDYKVHIGGLFRCCLASLSNQLEIVSEPLPEGTVITCEYCKSTEGGMILEGDTFRWNHK